MKKYRKKPIVVEAVQWNGKNSEDIMLFMGHCKLGKDSHILIPTLEGRSRASKGDYIIKGINGEFYPCKPDIFEKTYEEIINQTNE